jgi:hypothetical protein
VTVALAAAALGAGAEPTRAMCFHCGANGGCFTGGSYAVCQSGKILEVPYCVCYGACGEGGDAGGGAGDPIMRPRGGGYSATPSTETSARPEGGPAAGGRASAPDPVGRGALAAGDDLLTLYLLRLPLVDGFDPFAPGATAWHEGGAGGRTTPGAMLEAASRHSGFPPGRIPVIEEAAGVGTGALRGMFAAADGDGYAILAETSPAGTRVRVCAVRGRTLAGPLADATLADGDLLCVRIRGGARDYALLLAPRHSASGVFESDEAARQERALFDLEAGPLTRRALDDGVRFTLEETPAVACP